MGQLSISLLRLGFLILLWALVLSAIGVLRADLYGTRVLKRGRGLTARSPRGRDGKPIVPARTSIRGRGSALPPKEESHLYIVAGPLKGTVLPLGSAPVMIGRAPTCTVVIEDDYCSARHARVYLDGDVYMVEDLGSTNGSFLGDHQIDGPEEFPPGIKLRIGATAMEIRT